MARNRWEVGDVESLVTATVSEDGRIWGLKEFAGRRVFIVVQSETDDADALLDR